MILDKYLQLADAQVATQSAATESFVDLVSAGDAMNTPTIVLTVDTAFTSTASDGTLDFTLQADETSTFASATTIATLPQIAEASLVADAKFTLPLPKEGVEQYVRGYFTVGGTADFTTGAITVNVTPNADLNTIG